MSINSIKLPPLSLYIHIPWCVQKCPYCDFNSHTLKENLPEQEYLSHLLTDLEADIPLSNGREISTLFIGGGTPSLLSADTVKRLLEGIDSRIGIKKNAEITLEANPGAVDANHFKGYRQAGVNRISIGVQSFNAEKLVRLERIHNPSEAKRAVQLATELNLRSVNLDLMHGLPEQSLKDAMEDLQQAIELNPPHLSWYQLTIEPNTLFSSRPPTLPNDDLLWDIYQQGHALLNAAGYQQYETSAYAKKGNFCAHNLNYWRFGDYLGIGCGAHGKLTLPDGRILRTSKTKHPRGFMRGEYRDQLYNVPNRDRPFEFFLNRFRLFEAIPRTEFTDYTGVNESWIRSSIDKALSQGYLKETQQTWQVTKKGQLFLNSLLELFLSEIE